MRKLQINLKSNRSTIFYEIKLKTKREKGVETALGDVEVVLIHGSVGLRVPKILEKEIYVLSDNFLA